MKEHSFSLRVFVHQSDLTFASNHRRQCSQRDRSNPDRIGGDESASNKCNESNPICVVSPVAAEPCEMSVLLLYECLRKLRVKIDKPFDSYELFSSAMRTYIRLQNTDHSIN